MKFFDPKFQKLPQFGPRPLVLLQWVGKLSSIHPMKSTLVAILSLSFLLQSLYSQQDETPNNGLPKPAAQQAPKVPTAHQKALAQLESSHQALAAAEKAFQEAKKNLALAEEAHERAHLSEIATRPVPVEAQPKPKSTDQADQAEDIASASDASPKKIETTREPALARPPSNRASLSRTVGEAERRAKALEEYAEKLRENAEKISKDEQ